jgi:hypothetical protein
MQHMLHKIRFYATYEMRLGERMAEDRCCRKDLAL